MCFYPEYTVDTWNEMERSDDYLAHGRFFVSVGKIFR